MLAIPTSRTIVDSLPQAILLLDERHRIIRANRAAAALFRLPSEQLCGVTIARLLPDTNLTALLGNSAPHRIKMIQASMPRGTSGQARTLRISGVGVPRTHERLLVLEDVSETSALEQQLVEAEKRAALGQLAAGILHEVTNPLASLASNLLFVQNAVRRSDRTDVQDAIAISLDQVDEMRGLLGTLSGLPGRPSPQYEPADLHDIVQTSVAFVAHEAERRGIHIDLKLHPHAIACEMDVRLMKQVLLNLLKNAMEAMPHGGLIHVRTTYFAPPAEGRPPVMVIEVADTGIGIPEPDLRKVFRPLFSTKPRGAGLGLSFCRQAIEDHGGEIRLVSRGMDRGTAAIVTLPVQQAAPIDSC